MKKVFGTLGKIFGIILISAITSAATIYFYPPGRTKETAPQNPYPSTATNTNVSEAAQKLMPSVVGISMAEAQENRNPRSFFDLYSSKPVWSTGSGVLVSEQGYILTNHHVIGDNPLVLDVMLPDGKRTEATAVWSDPTLDLAVIKVNGRYTPAQLGNSDDLQVGATAIAIGNPLGPQLNRSVTLGIVSALGRTISVPSNSGDNFMEGLIQTDASINPGNSGGPLVTGDGQVIGINTVKVESAEGIGFAVPINYVKPVLQNIMENGKFDTPYLGLYTMDNGEGGIEIAGADPLGPAYQSGLREGDQLLAIDNVPVTSLYQLRKEIYSLTPGRAYPVKYSQKGIEKTADVTPVVKTDKNSINR